MKTLKMLSVLISMLSFPAVTSQSAEKPVQVQKSEYDNDAFRKALFDASRVFGRAGCGDADLAQMTARAAIRTGLPGNVIAAEIATESTCDPLAVSKDGGVGLLQIMPKIWASKFDNFRDKNLLKAEDSMEVGTTILADNIKQWGLREGIRHYNGAGPQAEMYAIRVMSLAGAK
jgi:soluble lytic murein transglycosylase-like protein